MRVRWTESALADLEEALAFIAADNGSAAQGLSKRIRMSVRGLRKYPERGRMVPEYQDPTLRELIVGPFRIIYSIRDSVCLHIIAALRAERSLPEAGW